MVGGPVPWRIDNEALCIDWQGVPLGLTPVEFRMLRQLLGQPGRVFTRSELLDAAHEEARDVSDRAIDSHVKNLRRKLQAAEPGLLGAGIGVRRGLPVRSA